MGQKFNSPFRIGFLNNVVNLSNTYTHDTRGRLTQALSAISTTSYQVNSLGQRIRKTNSQGDTIFHYDSQGKLIAETSASGATRKEYIYLGDIPVAVIQ